ncbi:MAG: PfkB family carbohydrate kinase [Proteobacteria bacterium]|nr:PfkB family carbohydrate kinase [Pseudomonadota bacterium]
MGSGSDATVADIRQRAGLSRRVVFVSGNFNIVHPGHLRLLQFAADCGDFLVVGVTSDTLPAVTIPAAMRLEGVRAIGIVDHAFLLDENPESFVARLKPAVVVKGKEYESRHNPERDAMAGYGGTLLFGSGEVRFSSLDLLQRELLETNFSSIRKPVDFPKRHGFVFEDLAGLVQSFSRLRVAVLGDLIVDEYINCDPLGMSQEDPTIVVTPIRSDRFIGGAGIVAAHARGLGAEVSYFGVTGIDATSAFADEILTKSHVKHHFIVDESRPTTLKQRYRADGKTLLRVSHLKQHDISRELAEQMFEQVTGALDACDLLIFSDFNYGCLPQSLVERVIARCREKKIMMVADSQASSQIGDVSRFRGMRLLTPTEHEARLAVRDYSSGLVVLAEQLRQQADARQLFITLGAEGLLIHAPEKDGGQLVTDQLPAFNTAPKDASGAGDSLLTCASMALASGADIWRSAYLGCVASACQVGRVGNSPLLADELIMELRA